MDYDSEMWIEILAGLSCYASFGFVIWFAVSLISCHKRRTLNAAELTLCCSAMLAYICAAYEVVRQGMTPPCPPIWHMYVCTGILIGLFSVLSFSDLPRSLRSPARVLLAISVYFTFAAVLEKIYPMAMK